MISNLDLTTLLMNSDRNATTFHSRENNQAQKTLASMIQDASIQCMGKFARIADAVAGYCITHKSARTCDTDRSVSGVQQGKELLKFTARIM